MLYRAFRRTDTGQWLDVIFATEADEFASDPEAGVGPESQAADLAAGIGIDPELLAWTDAEEDPRTGTLAPLPTAEPIPPAATVEDIVAEFAAYRANMQATIAQRDERAWEQDEALLDLTFRIMDLEGA